MSTGSLNKNTMKNILILTSTLIIGSALFGCQMTDNGMLQTTPALEKAEIMPDKVLDTVSGTVAYRERIALPDNAIVRVSLFDVSKADAPATLLGTQEFTTWGQQVPFEFSIPYDCADIDPKHRYSISARIEVDGRLMFISDSHYGVITDDKRTHQVEMNLIRVHEAQGNNDSAE